MTTIAYFPHEFPKVMPKMAVRLPQIIELASLGIRIMPALCSDLSIPEEHERGFPYGYWERTVALDKIPSHKWDLAFFDRKATESVLKLEMGKKWTGKLEAEFACLVEHAGIAAKVKAKVETLGYEITACPHPMVMGSRELPHANSSISVVTDREGNVESVNVGGVDYHKVTSTAGYGKPELNRISTYVCNISEKMIPRQSKPIAETIDFRGKAVITPEDLGFDYKRWKQISGT